MRQRIGKSITKEIIELILDLILKNLKGLLILFFSFNFLGCAEPKVHECAEDTVGRSRLVAFGDSQTQGVKSNIDYCQFSYAYVMARDLRLNIMNRARGGSSLMRPGGAGPSQYDMIHSTEFESEDIVVFQPGFNNIGQEGSTPALFESDLHALLVYMSGQVSHVYVATTLPVFNEITFTREAYEPYVQAIRDAALGVSGVTVIETESLVTIEPKDLIDRIHINQKMQTKLGHAYSELIE